MDTRLRWVRRLAATCVAMTVLLMALGAWVKANGAGLACPDWPACYGEWLPPFPSVENGGMYEGQPVVYTQAQELYEWTHRAVVALLAVPLGALALAVLPRAYAPALRGLPWLAVGLFFMQAGLGAVTVVTGNPPWATTMHLVMATVFLLTLTCAMMVARLAPLRAGAAARGSSGKAGSDEVSPAGPPPAWSRGYVWREAEPVPLGGPPHAPRNEGTDGQ